MFTGHPRNFLGMPGVPGACFGPTWFTLGHPKSCFCFGRVFIMWAQWSKTPVLDILPLLTGKRFAMSGVWLLRVDFLMNRMSTVANIQKEKLFSEPLTNLQTKPSNMSCEKMLESRPENALVKLAKLYRLWRLWRL